MRELDRQGRIVIPKKWRDQLGRRFIMRLERDGIKLMPVKVKGLTEYFDSIEVELKSDLSDWHAVKRELRRAR
ncbi:MAG: AbrB/MazE/SpoVT family DNA-binding domain-containing protein [Candidatus Hadarchaeales archaeon]